MATFQKPWLVASLSQVAVAMLLSSCGGGGGGGGSVSPPPVDPPPAPPPSTSSTENLILSPRLSFDDGDGAPLTQRVVVVNSGDLQFEGLQDSEWAIYIGDNLKAVPSALFPPQELIFGQPVVTGTFVDTEIAPGGNEQVSVEAAVTQPARASYLSACVIANNEPVYATCGRPLQFIENEQTVFETGQRALQTGTLELEGFNGEGGSSLLAFPDVDLISNSIIEGTEVSGTLFFVENASNDIQMLEEDAYQIIAFDPELPGFIPGFFSDVLPAPLPTGDDFDLLGITENGVWPALGTVGAVEDFDPGVASTARYFTNLDTIPDQIQYCVVAVDGNTITYCTETLVRGFAGPPGCADGFVVPDSEAENRTACDAAVLSQSSVCAVDVSAATLLASSEQSIELGLVVNSQGCEAATLEILLPQTESASSNEITGDICQGHPSQPQICSIGALTDGSYDITAALNQCADTDPAATISVKDGPVEIAAFSYTEFCGR